jgi:hypothetical protein
MNHLEITTTELQKWLNENKPVFILDVQLPEAGEIVIKI